MLNINVMKSNIVPEIIDRHILFAVMKGLQGIGTDYEDWSKGFPKVQRFFYIIHEMDKILLRHEELDLMACKQSLGNMCHLFHAQK